jgi:hypothetical protein
MSVGSLALEGPYPTGWESEATISVLVLIWVPFPHTVCGEPPCSGPGLRLSLLETLTPAEMNGNGISYTRNQYRGQYNSEVGISCPKQPRPNSFDDGGIKAHCSRYESMVNLGTGSDALMRESSVHGEIIILVFTDGKEHEYVRVVHENWGVVTDGLCFLFSALETSLGDALP